MSDDNDTPIHEQAYQAVVEWQEAQKRRDNAWHGGTNYGRSSPATWGAMIGGIIAAFSVETKGVLELFLVPLAGVLMGGACGWLFGRGLRLLFVTLPSKAVEALRKKSP